MNSKSWLENLFSAKRIVGEPYNVYLLRMNDKCKLLLITNINK